MERISDLSEDNDFIISSRLDYEFKRSPNGNFTTI